MVLGKKTEHSDEREPVLYELGYHLLPTIAEESLGGEVSALKDAVESHGGIITSDELPRALSLAYPIFKALGNKKKSFTTAYFGWLKFQMPPQKLTLLEEYLRGAQKILRFLVIRTVREKPMSSKRMSFLGRGRMLPRREKDSIMKGKDEHMTEEELDKTIEKLVTD